MLSSATAAITEAAVQAATKAATEMVQEYLEKKDKKNNLVVVGLPETAASEIDQHVLDVAKIGDYCTSIGISTDSVSSVFRDGKKIPNRPRILNVCFQGRLVFQRKKFLRGGTKLLRDYHAHTNLNFKPFVRLDVTKKERDKDYAARQQVKEYANNGDRSWMVRNGKCVRRRYAIDTVGARPGADRTAAPDDVSGKS